VCSCCPSLASPGGRGREDPDGPDLPFILIFLLNIENANNVKVSFHCGIQVLYTCEESRGPRNGSTNNMANKHHLLGSRWKGRTIVCSS